eukprot:COSAG04_NODE_4269_length_2197_cov_1.354623_1_plen_182_part_00
MSIYGDADGLGSELSASGGGGGGGGGGGKGASLLATIAASPLVTSLQAKAAADPQKAKVVGGVVAVLFGLLLWWCFFTSNTPVIASCDNGCPDILFSVGLIGSAADACGKTHVHDASMFGHTVALHGDTRVTEIGAHFDGGGDYITVEDFDYYTDGGLSLPSVLAPGLSLPSLCQELVRLS